VNATGGAQQLAAPIEGLLDGGTARVNNLEIDLVNKRVYADLYGDNGFDPVVDKKHVYLWDIGTIQGPTVISPAALLAAADGDTSQITAAGFTITGTEAAQAGYGTKYFATANNVLSGLKVTQEGFDFFINALGIPAGGTAYNTLAAVNNTVEGWGSMKSQINFSAREVLTVPEPSTYALMGLGLVGISLVARRRAK
jgi:PEP-CTERM motif